MSPALRVIARPAWRNRASNPYNARIADQLAAHGVEMIEHELRAVGLSRADVVHVHWPERAFKDDIVWAQISSSALLAGLRWQRARGAKLVWTAHNLRAHERRHPAAEERFWRRYLPLVDGVIALGEGSLERVRELRPQLEGKPSFVIPHPHYRGEYRDEVDRRAAREALGIPADAPVVTFFGRIRRYKNVPDLIEAASRAPDAHLVVAGDPHGEDDRRAVLEAAAGQDRLHLHLRFVGDEETQLFLRAADLVALPYDDPLNSGAALLALSFDRPVWLPPGSLADELDARLPSGWVLRGELSPEGLRSALERARALPERTAGEHLAAFDPERVAEAHARAYREVAKR